MPRSTPADLATEIRVHGGPWSLCAGRLLCPDTGERRYYPAVSFNDRAICSEVTLGGARREAIVDARVLERSGYDIFRMGGRPAWARRALRGLRELDAEARRLEALSRDREALRAFPPRTPRQRGRRVKDRSVAMAAFDHLRARGWSPNWVSVERKGPPALVDAPHWIAGAWCWFADDGDDRGIELHVQLFRSGFRDGTDHKELTRLARAFNAGLAPLGYRKGKLDGLERPSFAIFDKAVATLAAARRERERLDRVLFGD